MADRHAEIAATHARQDTVAAKHGPKIQAAIKEAMQEAADGIPLGRADIPLDHFNRIRDALEALYRDMTQLEASALVDNFKSGFLWIETKEDEDGFYEQIYEAYVQRYGAQAISSITQTTRSQLQRVIEMGLREGLSVEEIASNIRELAETISATRAHIIARTETHGAAMYASQESAKRSTTPLNKEWVTVEDGRVRDFGEGDGVVDEFSHAVMNGVSVPLDQPYRVPNANGTTEELMFPGDPNGSAGNIIACRCGQIYVAAGDEDE